eukprot:3713637-Amphidinium_carterae.2
MADIAARRFRQNGVPAITGGAFFRKINMMGGNRQDWHLSRDEKVKLEVMNFLENISDLLHHFSFDIEAGQKMWDLTEHSPTLAKARERCKTYDQIRERNRVRKEEDLRREKEARGKKAREMKDNENELQSVIRKDKDIQEQARKSAKEFMNDNADSGMLIKHCETKITRAIGDKNAALYAKFSYILAMATGRNVENIFDNTEAESSADEGRQQGGLTGKTTPEGDEKVYPSKYIKKYPPESMMSQQIVEIYGNESVNQYIGTFPSEAQTKDWMRRFSEKQLRIKAANAQTIVDQGLYQTKRYMPEVPTALLVTMAEAEITCALHGFSALDDKYRRTTGLNFEDPKGAKDFQYDQYVDIVFRPILGDGQGVDAVDGTYLYNISKSLTGNGRLNG